MKKKIIGIFVCIVVFFSTVIPVASITDKNEIRATSYDADVPIWEVGDEWTYHFTESVTGSLTYSLSGDLTFQVVDDSGDSYVLEAATKPHGSFALIGSLGLKTTLLTALTMRLQMRKADLGLEYFSEKLKGIFLFKIGPITLPIPIQADLNMDVEFDPTWVIIPFPLYDGKYGNLSSTEFWHTNSYFHLLWGLIPLYGPFNESWPITSVPYTCSGEEITVEAGTFDVYNVSAEWMEGSRFVSYYSEEVGNVAKEVIYLPYGIGQAERSLILELKDWSYTP